MEFFIRYKPQKLVAKNKATGKEVTSSFKAPNVPADILTQLLAKTGATISDERAAELLADMVGVQTHGGEAYKAKRDVLRRSALVDEWRRAGCTGHKYECPKCGELFPSADVLRDHRLDDHTEPEANNCHECLRPELKEVRCFASWEDLGKFLANAAAAAAAADYDGAAETKDDAGSEEEERTDEEGSGVEERSDEASDGGGSEATDEASDDEDDDDD